MVELLMKAKEYAEKFLKNPTSKTVGEIGNAFLQEIGTLQKQRKAQSNGACFAILNELEQKWKAFVRLTTTAFKTGKAFPDEGFAKLVEMGLPELYKAWKGE